MIKIDASQGEGGGQVLRTALALSIITQQAIHLTQIRAKRSKPGLMRQHLTCVKAAQAISDAEVSGAELGSDDLVFTPKAIRSGDYHFAIGTAGSCSLVLQTVLWPLLLADQESSVIVEGGTHVPMAPSFEFLQYSFLPVLRKMGVEVDIELVKHGFYPGGGGKLKATIKPWREQRPLKLTRRGDRISQHALCLFANLEQSIADTQLAEVRRYLNWQEADVVHHGLRNSHGIGNALILSVQSSEYSEIVTSYGDKSRSSGQVAQVACDEMKRYLASPAAVGEHMADQLLIPLALAGGTFTCNVISQHFKTNCEIIQKFTPSHFKIVDLAANNFEVNVSND
ncbi:RNA 3'-terminal phosphate cyclase [Undibacterium cyanobacteriorum]|uniref:RNA 3'-terminal phosphate cyclase n=1 Tax=Undibacterium cyanobacteriorum TaxID=3073561 RepID=A0ABY9RGE4_9BURK|nr:RNA 3'-terminal phosphate cyclase [Undibacterium sp. 20NA77.5]WMW80288.1 RNA 3'-terminal phosphate cyclase [Undibacterium sp. 20NA77.5]